MRTREIHLVRRPTSEPTSEDFTVVTTAVPEVGAGQVLIRNRYLALGAVMRDLVVGAPGLPAYGLGEPLYGKAVGEVVATSGPTGPSVGATVVHMAGWREHAVVAVDQCRPIDPADVWTHLSSGFTAYVGLRLAGLRPGETVHVSSAAGAVGSTAARLARALGAGRVIGGTRGEGRFAALTGELGYDAAVRYGDLDEPVDVYLDTIGDLNDVARHLNRGARVALCGALSHQLGGGSSWDPSALIARDVTVRGYLTAAHRDLEPDYLRLVAEHDITPPHTIVPGLEAAPGALVDLLAGRHLGLVAVEVGPAGSPAGSPAAH